MSAVGDAMEDISRLAQKCFASNPVIILGSGASLHHGLPSMSGLQKYLEERITPSGEAESDAWTLVRSALANGDHLEQALADKSLPSSLISKIVSLTWRCINAHDQKVYFRAISGNEPFPVADLVRGLFQSSNSEISIVTTNYDRLAEYACDSTGVIHSCGFTPGYIQAREGTDAIKIFRGGRPSRTVRIWKVHGSLDWFERQDGTPLATPLFEIPDTNLTPLIVTPGVSKYQRTHDEPFRSAIQGADRALEHAQAYISVGFGFRDRHIEPKLVAKCRQDNVPITILAQSLTPEARSFLATKAGTNYLAFEMAEGGTKAYSAKFPNGIAISGSHYWSLPGFLKLIS